MDQCISVSDRIDEDLVRQCSGAADSEYLFALSQAAIDKSPADALGLLDKLIVQGKDISRFIEELTSHYRNLMLEKTVGEELIKASDNELEQYRRQSKVYSLDEIMYHIDLISDSLDNINRMKQTGQARLLAEQLLIRLTSPKLANDAAALAARIGSLESRLEKMSKNGFVSVREEAAAENKAIPPKAEEKNAEKTAGDFSEEKPLKTTPKEDNIKTSAEEPPQEFYSHRSETITERILPVYDDIPLPPPPPEEAFEGGFYGYEDEAADLKAKEKTEEKTHKPKAENPITENLPKKTEKAVDIVSEKSAEKKASADNTASARPIPEIDFELPQGTTPLPQWQEIVTGMPARSRGLLKSSQAYLYDGKIYISSTASSEKVLKDGAKAGELRNRIKAVLGGDMETFILKAAPPAEEIDSDKVTPFLQKAERLGINITVR